MLFLNLILFGIFVLCFFIVVELLAIWSKLNEGEKQDEKNN